MKLMSMHVEIEIADDFVDEAHPNHDDVERGDLAAKSIVVKVINLSTLKSDTQSLGGIVIDPQSPSDACYIAEQRARLMDEASRHG